MLHNMGPEHPESPARIGAILKRLQDTHLLQELVMITPEPASRAMAERVHRATYLDQLEVMIPKQGRIFTDPDTAIMPFTLQSAYLAAGAAVEAVDLVLAGKYRNAFCATRPPGHHAERGKSMGFCFLNNVAIAAAHAMSVHGLERIAIIDFDVHQGNGTVDIFESDPRVLFCSSFQHPFYPESHYFSRHDNIVNTPLAAHTSGCEFRRRVEREWLARLESHRPELILVSAGFDAHRDDPMADLELVEADYGWVTELIMDVARQYAQGRVVSVLEGGYDLMALANSVHAHLEVLSGA